VVVGGSPGPLGLIWVLRLQLLLLNGAWSLRVHLLIKKHLGSLLLLLLPAHLLLNQSLARLNVLNAGHQVTHARLHLFLLSHLILLSLVKYRVLELLLRVVLNHAHARKLHVPLIVALGRCCLLLSRGVEKLLSDSGVMLKSCSLLKVVNTWHHLQAVHLLVFLIHLLLHLKLEDFLLHFILLLDCHGLLVLLHMLNELMVAHALSVGLVLLFKLHLLLPPEGLLVLLRVHWHKHKLVLLLLGQLLT